MRIPEPNNSISELINKYYESKQSKPRPHLGASVLGHPCDRKVWLSFRWAVVEKFNGRILRLFKRGQNEEAEIIRDLRNIGVNVLNVAAQSRVDFGCHVSGSIDAIIQSGLPGYENKKHIVEMKTHSKKSFDDLEKHGVQKSKPEHYAQMQIYMLGTKIDRALYYAVCKDDDRIYTERVKLDKTFSEGMVSRGHRLALEERLPPPISTDPSWHQCKFCPAYDFCHNTNLAKEVNCRTCARVTPTKEGEWHCDRWKADVPVDAQYEGCESHVLHPDLVPWKMQDSDNENEAVYLIDNTPVRNGEPCANCYSSKEIIANTAACVDPDDFVEDVRNLMTGRIAG